MEFIMDMVHHNPGEAPFETAFLNPEKLREYGYNAQVFKHVNTAITFRNFDPDIFPEGSEDARWIDDFSKGLQMEIRAAKDAGLSVYYHIDLFVLPGRLVEKYRDEICDADGKISLHRPKTLEIHAALLDELFDRFKGVDGLIIRVGETYLHDTPYHVGNGAVQYGDLAQEKKDFISLLQFLRQEVCIKHSKLLFFRIWDCFPDRFHADPDYYLAVTEQVEPHQNLIFSVKHTALDFWRRVKVNECLGIGKHRQIVEVQCQREYEGKGAYPMYVMDGVINAFEENFVKRGLKDLADNPLICGLYTWTRGGGWHGPYIKNEFWCDLNAYVIAQYARTHKPEAELFAQYATEKMGLSAVDAGKFRKLCLLSARAVLKGRYIERYDDVVLKQSIMPCANWMRDDKLGGLTQLGEVFGSLYQLGRLDAALAEKEEAVSIWKEVKQLCSDIHFPDTEIGEYVSVSIEYAIRLFTVIACGWKVMALGYQGDQTGSYDKDEIQNAVRGYDEAWADYQRLAGTGQCASLYRNEYWDEPGLNSSVERYRNL